MKWYVKPLVALGLLACICFLCRQNSDLKKEKDRLEQNQRTLSSDLKRYLTKDSLNGVQIRALNLSKSELEEYQAELVKRLDDRNIKIKNLLAALNTETEVRIDTILEVRTDTLYLGCVEYDDGYNKVKACYSKDNKAHLTLSVKDSIDIILHNHYKHRFLWWQWGSKTTLADVITHNPHSQISGAKIIFTSNK